MTEAGLLSELEAHVRAWSAANERTTRADVLRAETAMKEALAKLDEARATRKGGR